MKGPSCSTDVVLGVDVGRAAITVVALGANLVPGEVIDRRALDHPADSAAYPWSVLEALVAAVREAVGVCAVFGHRVQGLSVNTGSPLLLALDEQGRPLSSLPDHAESCSALADRIAGEHGAELHRLTGVPVTPGLPVVELAWTARHHRDLFKRAACWTGLKGFLIAQLTGSLVGDVSTWSGNGMLETRTLDWAQPVLDLAGLRPEQLPELTPPTTALPMRAEAARELALPAGTPVIVGASASATTHLGMRDAGPGGVALTMGGASALTVLEDGVRRVRSEGISGHVFADGLWVTRGAFDDGDVAGRCAAESSRNRAVGMPSPSAWRIPPESERWHPAYYPAPPGSCTGHDTAMATKALGVVSHLATVHDRMFGPAARTSPIRAAGEVLRSALWSGLVAAALDAPLEIVATGVAPALGAGLIAWRGLGRLSSLTAESIPVSPPVRTVQPDLLATAHFVTTHRLAEELARSRIVS